MLSGGKGIVDALLARGLRELHAVCRLDTHRFGYELRLEVNGLMSRTQVCRSTDESSQGRLASIFEHAQEGRARKMRINKMRIKRSRT